VDSRRLIDLFPDLAIYELNASGQVRGWSEAATKLLGFSSDEIIGHFVTTLAAQSTEAAASSALDVATQSGRFESFGWVDRKDGPRFWASEVTVPIRDDSGQITGFARLVRDVTSWKVAEEERDRIFTLSADLICVAGFDGFFKRINPAFTRILGYSETELLGKPFTDFIHPEDVPATQKEVAGLTTGDHEATRSFQNRYRRADGTYCWLEWKSDSIREDQLIYAVARDVTEQKAFEQKLEENAKELERSNGELQQFAYVASHDLQEPLRAVAGCVQMLGERNAGKLDDRSTELMKFAIDGATRMQTLINDLLAFSRVGSKGINKAWIDARLVAEKALRQLNGSIKESNAAITIGALPHAWADPVQLTQLFQNLIGNAIKFRTDRRPEIQVDAEQVGRETIFTVRDNGIGIAPEYHSKLFGLFQRLNGRREYAGTGIGLAICKKIVERHGGRIWVESRSGEGASFRFALPEGTKQ
jgi:PAS domain S-box-containing protein